MKPLALIAPAVAALVGGLVAVGTVEAQRAQPKAKEAPVPAAVRARTFELVGEDGKVLAALHAADGTPQFALYGTDGQAAVILSVVGNNQGMVLIGDPKSKRRAMLAMLGDGPALGMADGGGGTVDIGFLAGGRGRPVIQVGEKGRALFTTDK